MRIIEEPIVLTNPDILNKHYIPPNIPGREAQITELTDCLRPAMKRKKPIHAWLFGKPGDREDPERELHPRQDRARTFLEFISTAGSTIRSSPCFYEKEGKVSYRYGKEAKELERMDYQEFIARVTSHIPDKGRVTVRYYGLYATAHRGKVRKASLNPLVLRMAEENLQRLPSKGWAEMIRKVYEVDPLL